MEVYLGTQSASSPRRCGSLRLRRVQPPYVPLCIGSVARGRPHSLGSAGTGGLGYNVPDMTKARVKACP